MNLPNLILASGSPRRSEILGAVGWPFRVDVPDVDESGLDGESPVEYVTRLSLKKASKVASRNGDGLVMGADTTVVVGDEILGKPADLDDARAMLRTLSGRWHEVKTGVSLVKSGNSNVDSCTTRVKFETLSESEIDFLVLNGNPLDKAGAYAVQAQAALFIEKIEGDYWNVVGLPVSLLYKMASSFNAIR